MAGSGSAVELEVHGRTVRISNPDRVYFPARGETKLDLAQYYIAVADGAVRALRDRPCMLHRFPTGVTGEKVHQKRLPRGARRFGMVESKVTTLPDDINAAADASPVRMLDRDAEEASNADDWPTEGISPGSPV